MTKFRTIIIILIFAIILFILQNTRDKNSGINTVSVQDNVVISKIKSVNKPDTNVAVAPQDLPVKSPIEQPLMTTDNQLSYIDIYNKFKLAIDCDRIHMDEHSKYDKQFYVDDFVKNIRFRSNKRQKEVTDAQLRSYEDFVDQCWGLYLQMSNISDLTLQQIKQDPNITRHTLKNLLQSTDAFTLEEIELKKVLVAGFELSEIDTTLAKLSRGNNTLDMEDQKVLFEEIKFKNEDIRQLEIDNPHSYDIEEFDRLSLELKELEDYLTHSIIINETKLYSEKLRFDVLALEIYTHAHTAYASVFYEVFNFLNFTNQINGGIGGNYSPYIEPEYKEDYQTFSQRIFAESGINNTKYFDYLINPSICLYLCHLGTDCSENSSLMRQYCATNRHGFGRLSQSVYSEACGKSVNEFYSQSYLSVNLAYDVDLLFKYLVGRYAR